MVKLTKAQVEWLQTLEAKGPQSRKGHGTTPYYCMLRGLTQWWVRLPGKDAVLLSGFSGDLPTDREAEWLDGITPEGRKALEQANG